MNCMGLDAERADKQPYMWVSVAVNLLLIAVLLGVLTHAGVKANELMVREHRLAQREEYMTYREQELQQYIDQRNRIIDHAMGNAVNLPPFGGYIEGDGR